MKRSEVFSTLRKQGGKIFGVRFVKRTTGEIRDMQARMGVTKHLAGGEPSYDREAKQLLCVFDMAKKSYRSIPVEGVLSLTVDGIHYGVTDE